MEKLKKDVIIKKLTELGIEHNPNQSKEELINLFPKEEKEETIVEKEEEIVKKEYIVIYRFKDLQDNNKIYSPGDNFDAVGKTEERIKELSTTKNKIGKILIKEQR